MRFLSPSWLWLSLLAVPIIVLYMLKLRRREVQVSSILLWELLLRDRQANTPWQRLIRNLLLFLQLLILASLVLGLARPTVSVASVATGSVVLLLDASASMNAIDVEPSRFEAARKVARSLIDGLESGARMTLILVDQQPRVLAAGESNRDMLRRALQNIPVEEAPTQGGANWQAAFALAAGAASSQGAFGQNHTVADESRTTIVIISDGGLPTKNLPALPGRVRYVAIGKTGENLAISALALRSTADGSQLFAAVSNFGTVSKTAVLSFYLDGQIFSAQTVQVSAGERHSVNLSGLPRGAGIYMAQLSSPDGKESMLDPFPLDDTAFAVHQSPAGITAGNRRALMFSPGNLFLEQLLAAMPDITPFRAIPDGNGKFRIPQEPFDLYILDSVFPETLPDGELLVINPPPNPLFEVTGVFSDTGQVQVADHPLAQYVDWSGVHLRQARQVKLPNWAENLVRTQDHPLVFAGEFNGQRVAVVTFDLHDSDLPLQVTFPILFSNLLEYLLPAQTLAAPYGLQPGQALHIRTPQAKNGRQVTSVAIAAPSGKIYSLPLDENGVMFTDTDELGVYSVNYLDDADSQNPSPTHFFAVNLLNETESNIRPADTVQIGNSAIHPVAQTEIGQREFWPWTAGFALLVLLLEWLVYHQRLR